MNTKKARFQKYSGAYTCVVCGKKTRETGDGESVVDMCAKCYEEIQLENQHSDDGHEEFNPKCPTCRAEKGR